MEVPLPSFFVSIVSWLGLLGGIWALFERAETVASSQTKESVARWLRSLDFTQFAIDFPKTFEHIFDSIFGSRHLSFRCFFRSCLGSMVLVVIVTLIWGAIRFDEFMAFYKASSSVLWLLVIFVLVISVLNLIPDYISLLESRYVIRWMSKSQSVAKILFLIVLDIFVTISISTIVFWAFVYVSNVPIAVTVDVYFPAEQVEIAAEKIVRERTQSDASQEEGPKIKKDFEKTARTEITLQNIFLAELPDEMIKNSEGRIDKIILAGPSFGLKEILSILTEYGLKLSTPIKGIPSAGIWFYSTFLTSCWVVLYAIAGLMIVTTRYLGIGIKAVTKFLDIDGKPIRSIGFMAMLFVTSIYLILLISTFIEMLV